MQDQLDERQFEVDMLMEELAGKLKLIEEAESSQRQARRKAALFELANTSFCADQNNVQ